jgi:hypothetical protein
MLALAGMLAVAAAWLLGAEAVRSPALARLIDHGSATGFASCRAAHVAAARGDLWAECAEAFDDSAAGASASANNRPDASAEAARAATERAIAWAPFQSKAWLRLARAEARQDSRSHRAVEALRMSFYTGFNEVDLIPQRLLVSSQSEMLADADIERLVRHDVELALTAAPTMKPAILAAYRQAPPDGRRFLETAVADVDPGFVPELQSFPPGN